MKKFIFYTFLAASLVSACVPITYPTEVKVPFTFDIKQRLEKAGQDVTKIQFYNSSEIVLRRDLSSGEAKVASGKVEISDGKYIETVIIKAETPGICESLTDKTLTVSFEQGKSLTFSAPGNANDYFRISATDWKNNYGIVTYGENKYFIMPQSSKVSLLVQQKQVSNVTEKINVAPGRTIPSN